MSRTNLEIVNAKSQFAIPNFQKILKVGTHPWTCRPELSFLRVLSSIPESKLFERLLRNSRLLFTVDDLGCSIQVSESKILERAMKGENWLRNC